MRSFLLSGFADEAGRSIERQMDVLAANGINMIEMRGVDGRHVLDKPADGLKELKDKMDKRGFSVSAIGSPVGKSPVEEDFSVARAVYMKAVAAAGALGAKYIRGFSFYIPKGPDPMSYADEVARRVGELVRIASDNGVVYALENESDIFTDTPARCRYLLDAIDSPSFMLAFDPGNFIMNMGKPYPDAYDILKDRIAYFHIKDATTEPRRFVPSGEGISDMGALLAAAYNGGFDGVLSIEPHLQYIENLNDAQRFTKAVNALKATLNEYLGAGLSLPDLAEFAEYGAEYGAE